ncbi:hypothetical protein [Streptomyces sp. NPDC093261]|uniref:hypothetical protein n=1 Tax=Streptomyces sp. NPDC093261 TaxID=3366037 RepID=UPI00382718E6
MMIPKNMDREELLKLLDVIREGVASGDTLEGSIEFTLSEAGAAHPYAVHGVYRVGNLYGQGGMEVVGEFDGGEG